MTAPAKFEYDEGFQRKIAALICRDQVFMGRTDGLVEPDYFEDDAVSAIAYLGLAYYERYRKVPSPSVLVKLVKDAKTAKKIRDDLDYKAVLTQIMKEDLTDRDYVVDEVARFARHQALARAMLECIELLEDQDFEKIDEVMGNALNVGAHADDKGYDFLEEIKARTERRLALASGAIKPNGITTGYINMDKELKHRGWGRRELSVYMGGPKAGKTMALIEHALRAWLAGYNVLYVSLEVSNDIIADRMDANIAGEIMREIEKKAKSIQGKVEGLGKHGILRMNEYPTGSLTPAGLRRLIQRYSGEGILFDLIVVDYADIMAPNRAMKEERENLKQIYIDMRGIACERTAPGGDFPAVLTATQTNREGAKAGTAKMTDVSEDFNKIRIADLVISINADEMDRSLKEARLYFAASRNTEGGFTLVVKQDLERAKFIQSVIGRKASTA